MKNIYVILISMLLLSGCATKMAYLNTQKPPEEVEKDKADCQVLVDASDFKDADLKQKKFNECMKDKGYDVVSEAQAEKAQGFKELWVNPGADFKAYEAVFIDRVDLSQAKLDSVHIPGNTLSDEDINNLSVEMLKRFPKALSSVMPVVSDRGEAAGKKTLYISLKLNKVYKTGVGVNAALEVAGHFSPIPLPSGPEGHFSFSAAIEDSSDKERLIAISDEVGAGKNSSLVGAEKFSQWQAAYNVMDYWADHLAALLAKERGVKYKSQLKIKLL